MDVPTASDIMIYDKQNIYFSESNIMDPINVTKTGYSPGHASLSMEHIRYGGR